MRSFGDIDWMVLVAYAAALLGIGFYFAGRQRTTEEYFTGGRRIHPLLAGVSIFAASFSVISYIAYPGEYVQFGPTLTILAPLLALPVVYLIIGWLVIPVIMRLPITSVFELLEARLGRSVRQAGSLSYIVVRLVWTALILYVSSTMLVRVLNCDPRWSHLIAIAIGAVTTTYTLFGGIRTVMITEAIQSSMLMLGALLTILLITLKVGGVGMWFPRHWEAHWPVQPFFSLDPHVRITKVGSFVTLIIAGICYMVTDQSVVQRLLTTRDAASARRAYLLSNGAIIVVYTLLSLVGAALLVFYRLHPEVVPDHLTFARNGDAFFPLYLSHGLPHGISGLVVASLLAAAMSCLAGALNSTTTVIIKDFIEIWWRRDRSEAAKMRISRVLVLILGMTAISGSIAMGSVNGNLNEVASKTADLLLCPTLGLFFLAIFVKFSTPFGAIFGAIYSTTAAAMVGYWDVFMGQPKLSFLWIMPISLAVSMAGGCLFSLLPTRGRRPSVISGYAVVSLVPLVAIVGWMLGRYR